MHRLLVIIGLLAFLVCEIGLARAQTCNPVCSSQPPQCCGLAPPPPFLAEECTTDTSVHFVLPGSGTGWQIVKNTPAGFDVSGQTFTTTIGSPIGHTFTFTIGDSNAFARFNVIEASTLSAIGKCVGTSGVDYSIKFPLLLSQQGRALQASGRNPLFCRYTPTGGVQTQIICFQVKGDVGGPFEADQLCAADRVEYACGIVS